MGIVIIEGSNETRKSTLGHMFEESGYIYIKDINRVGHDLSCFSKTLENQNEDVLSVSRYDSTIVANRLDALVGLLIELDKNGIDVVIDRFHISEKVYSEKRKGYNSYLDAIDTILSLLDCSLILLYDKTQQETEETKLFIRLAEKSKIKNKYVCEKNTVTKENKNIIDIIESKKGKHDIIFKYDFYLASPFFNDEQTERMQRILTTLRKNGYNVFAPYESGVLNANATDAEREEIFNSNIEAIKNSESILCITDGKDIGTIWEAGYGKALNKNIVYYCETLGNNPFNVMLAKSAKAVFTDYFTFLEAAKEHEVLKSKNYEGAIQ